MSLNPIKDLSKTLYSYCLVLVDSRNRFECDLHNCLFYNWTNINECKLNRIARFKDTLSFTNVNGWTILLDTKHMTVASKRNTQNTV